MSYLDIKNLYANQDILLFKECWALEKIHGCLEASTQIETENGIKTIQEICESNYRGNVLSFDTKTGKISFSAVTDHSIGEETDDWFEIELDSGEKIIATSNHRFWLEDLKCWRQLSDLVKGDNITIS